jgi:hypothetical protein
LRYPEFASTTALITGGGTGIPCDARSWLTVPDTSNKPSNTITVGGDLVVGRVGYGAMQLTGKQVWGEYPDRDGGIALLRAVVEAVVTFIDTADVYGPHSNEILR